MKNKDIKVQAFPINKTFNNNKKVFYSKNENIVNVNKNNLKQSIAEPEPKGIDGKDFADMNVTEKIDYLTHLPMFMEDVFCSIVTNDGEFEQIIEETSGDVIILKNGEKILISDIQDIRLI